MLRASLRIVFLAYAGVRAIAFVPQAFFGILVGAAVFGEGDLLVGLLLLVDALAGPALPTAAVWRAPRRATAVTLMSVLLVLDTVVAAVFVVGAGRVPLIAVPWLVFAAIDAGAVGWLGVRRPGPDG